MAGEDSIAERCFSQLRDFYPELKMRASRSDQGEPQLSIPQQQGLCIELELYLYRDVLNLCAQSFWGEWFPCRDPEVCQQYVEVICGLIEGNVRIVEHVRGGRVLKVVLQRQRAGEWSRIYSCYRAFYVPFLKTQTRVLRNIAA